jgi:uncharacterized protein with PIN domain
MAELSHDEKMWLLHHVGELNKRARVLLTTIYETQHEVDNYVRRTRAVLNYIEDNRKRTTCLQCGTPFNESAFNCSPIHTPQDGLFCNISCLNLWLEVVRD